MSMLSSQADELRTLADKLRIVSFDERANYVENVDTLYRAMGAMREAADTITSLWNSLTVSEAALADAELGSQREKELEQLVRDIYDVAARGEFDVGEEFKFSERMAKLGVVSEC